MTKFTITGLAAEFARIRDEFPQVEHDALRKGAEFVEAEVKARFGHYQDGWPELADLTKTDRVRLGYSENDPLLRTGELRDSYSHKVDDKAHIGSNDKRAEMIEVGTKHMPPRPVLQGVLAQKGKDIAQVIGDEIAAKLGGKAIVKER